MPEVMFVLKSLVIAVVVMICLQIKIGNTSIEENAHQWIQRSSVSRYLQNVSAGAVLAMRNAASAASSFISETIGNDHTSQKAGRLNFEFQRSERYQNEQSEKEN